jgi:hypothetical protein
VRGNFTAAIKANHENAINATAFIFGIISGLAGSITDNIVIGPGDGVSSYRQREKKYDQRCPPSASTMLPRP